MERREESLSPFGARSATTRGRDRAEEPSALRTEFQRDRDRIIHSKAFRRLKHKTQVFIAPLGDHYVTRLTHTLEVAQIARTIARALNLNEDLTEAIGLGHDLGHTPFGHIGEEVLNELHDGGFRHSKQSLRIVEQVEKEGRGLNLTWEVREGIVSHSKPRGDFLDPGMTEGITLEAQICRVSDAVAYLNHDLADAFRAGVLQPDELPDVVAEVLGDRHSKRIDTMVTDIVESSWHASGANGSGHEPPPTIAMSPDVREAVNVLREFLFRSVYEPEGTRAESLAAREIVKLLYRYYTYDPDSIPRDFQWRSPLEESLVLDYISGMTDRYALRVAEEIQPGIARAFRGVLI